MSLQSISKILFEILIIIYMKEYFFHAFGRIKFSKFSFSLFKQYNKTNMIVQS
jgi:hypothetical protein